MSGPVPSPSMNGMIGWSGTIHWPSRWSILRPATCVGMAPSLPQKGPDGTAAACMGNRPMRIAHSGLILMLVTLTSGGCFGGTGSGLVGTSGGDGGTGNGAAVLAFFVQPNTANVRQVISPPVEVVVRDSLGSIDSAFTATITIELGSNSTGDRKSTRLNSSHVEISYAGF